MIASNPVRLTSLAIVALVAIVGVRVIVGGFTFGGDPLGTRPTGSEERGVRTTGAVAYVLDGDTVQVDLREGRTVRVRLLGISSPEIPHPGEPGECYGHAATRHLKKLLPIGTRVTMVSDPTQDDADAYGRWLRYVQASGRDMGAVQIRSGAASARTSSTPVARHSSYTELEAAARGHGAGMWSACR